MPPAAPSVQAINTWLREREALQWVDRPRLPRPISDLGAPQREPHRGKQVDTQPGETVIDIPWLRLDAIDGGFGVLAGVTGILRINTKGGQLAGVCDRAGTIMGVPYAADKQHMMPCHHVLAEALHAYRPRHLF